MHHMRDEFVRPGPDGAPWEQFQMPDFEEITAENLKYDLDDAMKLQARTLGCSVPEALRCACGLHLPGSHIMLAWPAEPGMHMVGHAGMLLALAA